MKYQEHLMKWQKFLVNANFYIFNHNLYIITNYKNILLFDLNIFKNCKILIYYKLKWIHNVGCNSFRQILLFKNNKTLSFIFFLILFI